MHQGQCETWPAGLKWVIAVKSTRVATQNPINCIILLNKSLSEMHYITRFLLVIPVLHQTHFTV